MRNKILAALTAGSLLVGAGIVTAVVSSPGVASAQETTDSTEDGAPLTRILGFLGDVLDELVGDDTISQEQADAIASAAETKATELKEEHRALRQLFRELLEDGVLTEEEAAELPDDHWVFGERFEDAWADGELTTDELGDFLRRGRRHVFRQGFRFGALFDDGGIDQEEYDSLGDDHPLKQIDVTEYLADGVITPDELREIHQDRTVPLPGGDS